MDQNHQTRLPLLLQLTMMDLPKMTLEQIKRSLELLFAIALHKNSICDNYNKATTCSTHNINKLKSNLISLPMPNELDINHVGLASPRLESRINEHPEYAFMFFQSQLIVKKRKFRFHDFFCE